MASADSTSSAETIIAQLLALGKKSQKENDALQDFVEKLDWDALNGALSWLFDPRNKRGATSAPDAVHYLYRGLNSDDQRDKRTQATLSILRSLRERPHLSRTCRAESLHRLALALDSASAAELAAGAAELVASVRAADDPHTAWRTALPKILALVAECSQVPRQGRFLTGAEFRTETLDELMDMEWTADSLTPLAIMFTDIGPGAELMPALAEKFCAALPALSPPALVALAQALMALLKGAGAAPLFFALARYFDKWVYAPGADQLDSEAGAQWVREAPASEATLRLCILDAAGVGAECLRSFLRACAKMVNAPAQLLSPFMLATLLALSQLATYKESCLKVLFAAVTRAEDERIRRAESAWLRGVVNEPPLMSKLFPLVVKHNHESERVMRGLVELCLRLVSSPRRPTASARSRAICAAAAAGLVAVARKRPREMAGVVLADLLDRALEEPDGMHLVDCVRAVVFAVPSAVFSCAAASRSALGQAGRHALGPALVRAVSPALAPRVPSAEAAAMREALVIVLRKDLGSNKVETRVNAVASLVHLLRHLEVKDLAAISVSSQCSQLLPSTSRDMQAGSSQSQRGFTGVEATCTDLLRALARCFGQQAAVRHALYTGLGRSASRNAELLGYVLDMLLGQLSLYLQLDVGGGEPPLRLAACFDAAAALKEPLGQLVLACALALARGDGGGRTSARLRSALDALPDKMAACQPDDLLLGGRDEAGTGTETLALAQDCLDALAAHVLLAWDVDSTGQADKLTALVRAHVRIADFLKPSTGKGGKGGKGGDVTAKAKAKAKKKAAAAAGTQAEEDAGAGKGGKPRARPGAGKPRAGTTDHGATLRLLSLVFQEGVSWSSERPAPEDLPALRQCALRWCAALAAQAQAAADTDPDFVAFASPAARLLWTGACANVHKHDVDGVGVRALAQLLALVALLADRWPRKLPAFFQAVGGGLESMMACLRDQLSEEDEPGEAVELALVRALAALAEHQDAEGAQAEELLLWLETRAANTAPTSEECALALLTLLLCQRRRCRGAPPPLDVNIARHLLDILGPADYHGGGDETFVRLRLVSAASAGSALSLACACVKETIAEASWFVERLDAELVALAALASQDEPGVRRRERALCTHAGLALKPAHALASLRHAGQRAGQRGLCALLTALYAAAVRTARHFLVRPRVDGRVLAAAKFDVLVKLLGGQFSETVAGFISSVQNVGVDDEGGAPAGKGRAGPGKNQADNMLPGITFQKETFDRYLIRLSRVAKTDLMEHVKVNGARDFRLKKTLLVADAGPADTTAADTTSTGTTSADISRASTLRANTSQASTLPGNPDSDEEVEKPDEGGKSGRKHGKATKEASSSPARSKDFSFSSDPGSDDGSGAVSSGDDAPPNKRSKRN